jgi:drug/metabolite transporter (DMT)-like permease
VVAILLALAAALSWGFSSIFVRVGLRYVPTSLGTLVSLIAGLLVTAALTLVLQFDELTALSLSAIGLFALIGLLNFPIGRFFNYMSISRLGVGRSSPLLASAPVFAMVIAVIFTGEKVDAGTLAGSALVLAGLYVTLRPSRPQ